MVCDAGLGSYMDNIDRDYGCAVHDRAYAGEYVRSDGMSVVWGFLFGIGLISILLSLIYFGANIN